MTGAAIVLEDPAQEAVATYVGPRVYRDGAYHIVDDNDGGDITYTFTASGNVSAEIQHYTLQDGEQLVDTTPPTMRPYTGAEGLVTPRRPSTRHLNYLRACRRQRNVSPPWRAPCLP